MHAYRFGRGWSVPITLAIMLALVMSAMTVVRANSHVIANGDVPGLIAAIDAANASGVPTTIALSTDGNYVLDTVHNTVNGPNGLPEITGDLTIDGNGSAIRRNTADGTPSFRIISVGSGGQLNLDRTTLSGGNTTNVGGGIFVEEGALTLTDSAVHNNTASDGGGIFNSGSVELNTTVISGNVATSASFGGGGILNTYGEVILTASSVTDNTANLVSGGGIANINSGTLTLNNSIVDRNNARWGGGIWNDNAVVTLNSSSLVSNSADEAGGMATVSGEATLIDSIVSENSSQDVAGGIANIGANARLTLSNSAVSSNSTDGAGAGIVNDNGIATIDGSTISDNTASGHGAGILNSGTLTLTDTVISENVSPYVAGTGGLGGGILNSGGQITITGSTLHKNHARRGGGIYVDAGTVTVTASTISDNTVNGTGAGIYTTNSGSASLDNSTLSGNNAFGNMGGGIMNTDSGTLTIMNSTLSDNSAGSLGGGIFNSGTLELGTTIVAGNVARQGGDPDIHGPVSSDFGHNLIGNDSGVSGLTEASNLKGTSANPLDPKLGSLQNNGGSTATMALLAASPALNVIPVGICFPVTDQRGVSRPQGTHCDIGAFESDASLTVPDFTPNDDIDNLFFWETWARTDLPVRDGHTSRTWMWGPGPFTEVLWEPYLEAPGGERKVIYFDKARMEINDPDADTQSIWYVTNGLLVAEMISGMRQFGDATLVQYPASQSNVAGDANDPTGPTYSSFAGLLDEPAQPVGTLLNSQIDRAGNLRVSQAWDQFGIRVGHVDTVTDHGIAAPFWSFMNSQGLIYQDGNLLEQSLFENPYYATGRPITEAYWADVQVGAEERHVLIQCFERRCLTYTPGNSTGFVVEAGNVGQHYYFWRYVQAVD